MRIKRGVTSRAKHNKIFSANKGYRMTKRRLIKVATEAHLHAGEYAFEGRKNKKRDFRMLWITRISEASKSLGLPYRELIHRMKLKDIRIDRKMLSYLVTEQPRVFSAFIDKLKTK